jgi:hypothetical protein
MKMGITVVPPLMALQPKATPVNRTDFRCSGTGIVKYSQPTHAVTSIKQSPVLKENCSKTSDPLSN